LCTGCLSEARRKDSPTAPPATEQPEQAPVPPALRVQSRHAVFPVQYLYYDFGSKRLSSEINIIKPGRNPREYLHFVYAEDLVYLSIADDPDNPERQIVSAHITDRLYDDEGNPGFEEPLSTIPVEFVNNKARFTVPDISPLIQEAEAAGQSLPQIRGFELFVDWGEESCTYFFAFRSGPVPAQDEEESEDEPELIYPEESIESSDATGMSVYKYAEAYNFPDDENAHIILYTSALPDAEGEFLMDDGQDWALVLRTERGSFPLMPRRFVQLGHVSVTVFTDENANGVFHVLVSIPSTAGIEIMDFIYNEDTGAFQKTTVYNISNINSIQLNP
jgi:hypothetical protein